MVVRHAGDDARRYLVTGGAGFIGSHVCDALRGRGNQVVALDDLSTGDVRNLAPLLSTDGFRLVTASILDTDALDTVVAGCDTVIHLAAAVGVKLVVEQPLHSLVTNVRGTENVIEAAHRHGSVLFVASSSEVYGKNPNLPLHEESDCVVGPPSRSRWGYSVSKSIDEHLARAFSAERGLRVVIGRLFNTVGPRQSPSYGMVIPRMIAQALAGEPITVFGDGNQTRCFCHVGDVVRAVLALVDEPAALGETCNIGSTEEVSINQLAQRVLAMTGSASTITHIPYEQVYTAGFEDMLRRVPDTSRITQLTGWTPTCDLDAILADVLRTTTAS
jgi:UDP-glucose 4-epimerase